MARARANLGRAAALHRQVAAVVEAAEQALGALGAGVRSGWRAGEQRALVERLRTTAAVLAPGWLSAPLDSARAPAPPAEWPALATSGAAPAGWGYSPLALPDTPSLGALPGAPSVAVLPGAAMPGGTPPADAMPGGAPPADAAPDAPPAPPPLPHERRPAPAGGEPPFSNAWAVTPTGSVTSVQLGGTATRRPGPPDGLAMAADPGTSPGAAGSTDTAARSATVPHPVAGRPARPGAPDPAPPDPGHRPGGATAHRPPDGAAGADPLGAARPQPPVFVRIGAAYPLEDCGFPVLVPLLGQGHLAIDHDAHDPRVAGLLRSVVLRLLAAQPAGSLRVIAVDATGTAFPALTPVATVPPDHHALTNLLAEGETWLRRPGTGRLLLVVAATPGPAAGPDLARLAALAQIGPASGLHLIVAGWPPPAPGAAGGTPGHPTGVPGVAARPAGNGGGWGLLPNTTHVALRDGYAVVGHPAGGRFGATAGLDAPVFLDPDPHPDLVRTVIDRITAKLASTEAPAMYELLPERMWRSRAAAGLETPVGRASNGLLVLRFNDLTPHWMIGGRSGAGKTALLIDLLYGLATRYGPDELLLYLLDFKEGVSFSEFTPTPHDPTWVPQARAVGVESDREYGVAVLRELNEEMASRADAFKAAGVTRFADLGSGRRIVCVIDEFQVLLEGNDALARESVTLLENIARQGRSSGIHLVLASQTIRGVEALYAKRDSIFGQFPVRIALPGGGDVLDPLNQSATALTLGEAVVNTAGGLGGPTGAARAHERIMRFPDPHANPAGLQAVRHRLWQARPEGNRRPYVFAGYAAMRLEDDPTFLSCRPGTGPRVALLGRHIDVPLTTATFPLDATPGRHLAVLGPSSAGADLLFAAAMSLSRQVKPGSATFAVWSSSPVTAPVATELAEVLVAAGHLVTRDERAPVPDDTFVLAFGADGTGPAIRPLLRDGCGRGVHVLGWWRGARRFTEDTGGSTGRDDVAGLVLLNVPAQEVSLLTGDAGVHWRPRLNRALLHDRHTGMTSTIVPFSRARRSP